VDAGRDLATLALHRQRQGAPQAPSEAAARLIRGTPLQQLARQLQDCATPAAQCELARLAWGEQQAACTAATCADCNFH
jgi:hypothetical protein